MSELKAALRKNILQKIDVNLFSNHNRSEKFASCFWVFYHCLARILYIVYVDTYPEPEATRKRNWKKANKNRIEEKKYCQR